MTKAFLIVSAALGRTVFITDQTAAETFASEQTEHTGRPHNAEPVDIHDNATALDAEILETTRANAIARMTPLEKKAFGVPDPAPAELAEQESDSRH